MSKFWLSKSTFVKSIQCQKALYLNKFHKDLKDEISDEQQALFSQGTNVGELAQGLFPSGIDVSPENYYDFSKSIKRTAKLLTQNNVVIYEASFEFEGVLCALDILVKNDGAIYAYEVKSSTEVKEVHIQDAGLQYFVMKSCGFEPSEIAIVHIDNQYIRTGDLELSKLFKTHSIKEEVIAFQAEIPALISEAKTTLSGGGIPYKDIGPHCNSPYSCDFIGHCWQGVPEYSIFDISGLRAKKKFELYDAGILNFEDLPADLTFNANQKLQIDSELSGSVHINKIEIRNFLNTLNYPLQFLDFETFQSPVPLFDNSKPYQQIVFQYSLHIQKENGGKVTHYEYLAEGNGNDPRRPLIDKLIEHSKGAGQILVYNIGFERGRLKELKELFPDKSNDIQIIIDRLVDLMIPFQKKHYYAPDLHGSYSIKKVLPSLVPDLSYSDLEISDGGMVMDVFKHMMQGTFEGDVEKSRIALLEYCKLDTYAMVKILEKIKIISLDD